MLSGLALVFVSKLEIHQSISLSLPAFFYFDGFPFLSNTAFLSWNFQYYGLCFWNFMMHKSVYLALFGILSASCGMSMMFSRFEKFFAITFLNEFQSVSFLVLLHTGFGLLVSVHHRSWMLCSWFLDFIFCYLNDFPTSHQLLIAFLTPGLVCGWYFLVRVSIWLSFFMFKIFFWLKFLFKLLNF